MSEVVAAAEDKGKFSCSGLKSCSVVQEMFEMVVGEQGKASTELEKIRRRARALDKMFYIERNIKSALAHSFDYRLGAATGEYRDYIVSLMGNSMEPVLVRKMDDDIVCTNDKGQCVGSRETRNDAIEQVLDAIREDRVLCVEDPSECRRKKEEP